LEIQQTFRFQKPAAVELRKELPNQEIIEGAEREMKSAPDFLKRMTPIQVIPQEILPGVEQYITVLAQIP
jgi:hypothetical protein